MLLADILENFRDVCMEHYKLDPAWYFTSQGLAWDAALKKTRGELELITDYERHCREYEVELVQFEVFVG